MDDTYDYVILGTGFTECVLSGILSVEGFKVLHMDRDEFYGGQCASLNLSQLFAKYSNKGTPPGTYGKDRDWNVDLIAKYLMYYGDITSMLAHTGVNRYLELCRIDGSYIYLGGRVSRVPTTLSQILTTPLIGLWEKNRMRQFFQAVNSWEAGQLRDFDPASWSMERVYKYYNLEASTQELIGHSVALYLNDDYKQLPAIDTFRRIVTYVQSISDGTGKSPYIYPTYGLSELPQGFARLSAIYGGTYMLGMPINSDGIIMENGRAVGVKCNEQVVRCTKGIIGDPTYFPNLVEKTAETIRVICILNHTIPGINPDDKSCQLILPQAQIGRRNDIYVMMLSSAQKVCPDGFYLAIISTIVETTDPMAEIQPAMMLLGSVLESFVYKTDIFEPLSSGKDNNIFISKTCDATSHFGTMCDDVRDIYRRMMAKELVLQRRNTQTDESAGVSSAQPGSSS